MPMSISELKNCIRQHVQIIDDPDDVANLLDIDISAETLRTQFKTEAHDRLWMFILNGSKGRTHFRTALRSYMA